MFSVLGSSHQLWLRSFISISMCAFGIVVNDEDDVKRGDRTKKHQRCQKHRQRLRSNDERSMKQWKILLKLHTRYARFAFANELCDLDSAENDKNSASTFCFERINLKLFFFSFSNFRTRRGSIALVASRCNKTGANK